MKVKDLRKIFLFACAVKLQKWAESLMRNIEADQQKESYNPEGYSSNECTTAEKPEADQRPFPWDRRASSGPPEHWLEIVRRRAPGFLQSMDFKGPELKTSEAPDETESANAEVQMPSSEKIHRPAMPTFKKKTSRPGDLVFKTKTPDQKTPRPEIPVEITSIITKPSELHKLHEHLAPRSEIKEGEPISRPASFNAIDRVINRKDRPVIAQLWKAFPPSIKSPLTPLFQRGDPSKPPVTEGKFHKVSSDAPLAEDTGEEFIESHTSEKIAETEIIFKPGVVVELKQKPLPETTAPGEDHNRPPLPVISPRKASLKSKPYKEEAPILSKAPAERPVKNLWPELPEAPVINSSDEWLADIRALERVSKLNMEQRGTRWNA